MTPGPYARIDSKKSDFLAVPWKYLLSLFHRHIKHSKSTLLRILPPAKPQKRQDI